MNSGDLFHRVTVQRLTAGGDDEYGGEVPGTPIILARIAHAEVTPLTGREFFDAQQIAASADRRVRLRWQPDLRDLRPKDQILFQGKTLDIQHVANIDERNREIQVLCKELV